MESGCSKNVEPSRPQLLDLIPQEKEWHHVKREDGSSEEKKLELRLGLGPPGEDNWYFPSLMKSNGSVLSTPWGKSHHHQQQQTKASSFLQFPSTNSLPVMAKESSQPCCNNTAVDLQDAERKAFKPPANTAVPLNTSQKRTAPGPVVGWPPIRSIRKNLASNSSSKLASEPPSVDPPHKVANEKPAAEPNGKTLFVKINMDGVPIGRKVDLKAHDSYEKLSTAVDQLFRGLLAAQRDSCAGGTVNKQEGEGNILDGSGEYTLVYEDNEGDSMLVGDVPWHMFVSTVKRLRALKSSELSALGLGSSKQGKMKA
ncbi:indole-3-acetic acid inducible 26, phytochrome-associated protein 1 [Hibiscus trionum]|uniref:Auxin-responsive protein n=1 Tax=Hibiscus trionum TaxID=183268 RepID=A0A9W7MAZ1_HIBTR|nr:indole-3-acetic acid inducible 26, phytochrome-associated protein 1 [Hibiscus trionum]